jgi:hypothetical protein
MAKAAMSVKACGVGGSPLASYCHKLWISHEKSVTASLRFGPDLAPDAKLV